MGNIVSQLGHLQRGMETIAGEETHMVIDEAAGHAVIVGTSIRTLPDQPDGTLDLARVEEAFRDASDVHQPITGLVTIENTHAHSGGQPLTPEYTAAIAAVAHAHGIPLHVDGARFWNAVVALGVRATDLSGPADSVMFCLSKGLACPIGSVVVGSSDFVWRARRARKLVGGGWRQAGILAAAGLVALGEGPDGMIERLAEDHANARRLADALAELDGVVSPGFAAQPAPGRLDPERVRTNFVLFRVERDRAAFLAALERLGVLMVDFPHGQIRAATHHGITSDDIDATIVAVRAVLEETAGTRGRPGDPARLATATPA
jgi:threonine aldolase